MTHGYGGGIPGPLPGSPAACGATRRGATRSTLHRGSAASAKPRCTGGQPAVPWRSHELGPADGIDGAVHRCPTQDGLSGTPARPSPASRPASTGSAQDHSPTVSIEGRPVKRLTQAEQERRRLGLCYNCDEKLTRGHNRVCKRLFLLEGAVENDEDAAAAAAEDDDVEQAPAYSFHVVAGVRTTHSSFVFWCLVCP